MDILKTILNQKLDNIKKYFEGDIKDYNNILIFTNMNPTGLITIYNLLLQLSKNKCIYNVLIVVGEGDEITIRQKIKYMYIVFKKIKYLDIEIVGGIPDDKYTFPVVSSNKFPVEQLNKYFKYGINNLKKPIITWPTSKNTIMSFLDYGNILCIYIKQLYELIELLEVWPNYDITFHIYSGFYFERLIANDNTIESLLKNLINDSNLSINLYDYHYLDIKGDNVIQKANLALLPYDMKQIVQNYNSYRLQNNNMMEDYKNLIRKIDNNDDIVDECTIDLFALQHMLKNNKSYYGYTYDDNIIKFLKNISKNIELLYKTYYFHRHEIMKLKRKVDDYKLIAENNGLFYLNLESLVSFNLLPNKTPKRMIGCSIETENKKIKYIINNKSRTKILKIKYP